MLGGALTVTEGATRYPLPASCKLIVCRYPLTSSVAVAVACTPAPEGGDIVTVGAVRYAVPGETMLNPLTLPPVILAVTDGWIPTDNWGLPTVTVGVVPGYKSPLVIRVMLPTWPDSLSVDVAVGAWPVLLSGASTTTTGGTLLYPVGECNTLMADSR